MPHRVPVTAATRSGGGFAASVSGSKKLPEVRRLAINPEYLSACWITTWACSETDHRCRAAFRYRRLYPDIVQNRRPRIVYARCLRSAPQGRRIREGIRAVPGRVPYLLSLRAGGTYGRTGVATARFRSYRRRCSTSRES